jgi:nucleoid DNA-binding protein
MNKKELVEKFRQELTKNKEANTSKSKDYAEKTVDVFFDSIANALRVGDKVDLRRFGVFQTKKYKFRKKNKDRDKSPVFKMSQVMRKKLNSQDK